MTSQLKQLLHARQRTLGSWITFPSEPTVEIMARAGFEWLALDLEHAPISIADAARAGIIVPSIESAEEAQRAVEAAYYPPRGRRGVGLSRAQGYGQSFETYRAGLEECMVVVAMIETAAGVQAADAIAETPGIDAVIIGPYDLSASLGHVGQLEHPAVTNACATVSQAAKVAGVSSGLHIVHYNDAALGAAVDAGHTFLALGVDMLFLGDAVSGALRSATAYLAARAAD